MIKRMLQQDPTTRRMFPHLLSRRGALITIAALFLFVPLVELALFSAQVSEKEHEFVELSLIGEKLAAIEDDLANSYRTIMGIAFTVQRVGNVQRLTVTNLFLQGTGERGSNRSALLQNYTKFMETTFANLSTVNLSLSLTPMMTVAAFNLSFEIVELPELSNQSILRTYLGPDQGGEDDRTLRRISLETTLSVLNSSLISQNLASEGDEDESLPLTLVIKDSIGTGIVTKTFSLELDSDARFTFTFNTTPLSQFNITLTEDAEELRIDAVQLNATLHRLDLDYDPVNTAVRVESSEFVVAVPGYAYRKEAPLLLAGG